LLFFFVLFLLLFFGGVESGWVTFYVEIVYIMASVAGNLKNCAAKLSWEYR